MVLQVYLALVLLMLTILGTLLVEFAFKSRGWNLGGDTVGCSYLIGLQDELSNKLFLLF
jgi:hypothetical protein